MIEPTSVKRIAVIGAGTMGGGIAAHAVNLGYRVTLYDVSAERAAEGLARARQARPALFSVPEKANEVETAGLNGSSLPIREADWVIEAATERPDVKRAIYDLLDGLVRPEAYVSSNTSGIPIAELAAGRSASFRARFVGTHFFNPPRYLKLAELILGHDVPPENAARWRTLLEEGFARRVVDAFDTPGFVTNRFGMWSMFHAIHTAERLGLSVEEADAITGPFLGRPKSGSFRLADVVGLDVMREIGQGLRERIPGPETAGVFEIGGSMQFLLAKGWIGDKAGQGYTRREGKGRLVLDLRTHAYREAREPAFPTLRSAARLPLAERLNVALDARDETGEYLRAHLLPVLAYARRIQPHVCESVEAFDRAIRWGFGWEMGPFETLDAIGTERLGPPEPRYFQGATYRVGTEYVARAPEPRYVRAEEFPVVRQDELLTLRRAGDVHLLSFGTKAGVITADLLDALHRFLDEAPDVPLVLVPGGAHFSVGFDLKFFLAAIEREDAAAIEGALARLQTLGERLETRRVVAAVSGYTLGAGLEIALSCPLIVAAAEAKIGLPESRVGLLPGGRGCTLVRRENSGTARRLAEVVVNVVRGLTGDSAEHAARLGYLRSTDEIVHHPDALISTAIAAAARVAPRTAPWSRPEGPTVGMIDREVAILRQRGELTEHDGFIDDKLKAAMVKAPTYEAALRAEREGFLDLCARSLTVARIRHMLEHKTPLRN